VENQKQIPKKYDIDSKPIRYEINLGPDARAAYQLDEMTEALASEVARSKKMTRPKYIRQIIDT